MYTRIIFPNNIEQIILVSLNMKIEKFKKEIKKFYQLKYEIDLYCDDRCLDDEYTLHSSHIWPDSKIYLKPKNIETKSRNKRKNKFNANAPAFISKF